MRIFSNKIWKESLKPGDHIYSWRRGYIYSHHGIYAGSNRVIHFSSRGQIYNPNAGLGARVVESSLESFLRGDGLHRFSYSVSHAFFLAKPRGGTCSLAKSDPPEHVLHRATCSLHNGGVGFGAYNFFKNNCEDFALYCKTGLVVSVGGSGQATALFAAGFTAVVVCFPVLRYIGVFTALVAYAVVYCLTRLLSDIGIRPDAVNLPVLDKPPESQLHIKIEE